MTRLLAMLALVSAGLLSACAGTPDSYVAGRADNEILRFSAANYAMPSELAR